MDVTVTWIKTTTAVTLLALMFILAGPAPRAHAADTADEQALVDRAQVTFNEFLAAQEMEWFRGALKGANGVLIAPGLLKAGLVFGGSGGKGVFFAKDENTGKWLGPAFYGLGSFTVGLQIGAEKSDVVLLAMTKDAVKAMVVSKLNLGTDASVAAGPVGGGASGGVALPTAGFLSFTRSKGAFVGLTLEGLVINVGDNSNEVYYGKSVNPEDIFISGKVVNPAAEGLREAIQNAAGGGATKPVPQEKAPASAAPTNIEAAPQEKGQVTVAPTINEAVPQEKGPGTAAPEREWPAPPENGLGAVPPEPEGGAN